MITIIKSKKNKIKIITQQYTIGLYIAAYMNDDPIPHQSTSRIKEIEYHRKLRTKVIKAGDICIKKESTVI